MMNASKTPSRRLPTALLFDLDDTILKLDAVAEDCWRSICRRYAPTHLGVAPQALQAAVLAASRWFWSDPERHRWGRFHMLDARRQIVQKAFGAFGLDLPQLTDLLAETYNREREQAVEPVPGAIETLRELRSRALPLALVTNGLSALQRAKLQRFGLAPLFDCIVIEEEFGLGKPEQQVYRHALEQLGASPEDAWMVGDNLEWEVAAPQELGIAGVWVDWRKTGLPQEARVTPHRIVHTISELLLEFAPVEQRG
ncbi:MAG: HAD family hydrolase [Chloroflexi bacterium]|nr:HAD family hydrolase [Chloroflexota bacterium]